MKGRPPLLQPVDPGLLKQCPHCSRIFGLKFVREENDEKVGRVYIYKCRGCGEESEYLRWFPLSL